ncbi:MAG: NAD-binding protein, partial [Acidobacteria bacterium]|nr:NAD-binding protein [Acidobacteriota bacterium]
MANEKVVVVGAGAVGCYFGGMLARAGVPVTFLRRPKAGAASNAPATAPLHIDSIHFQQSIPVEWSTDPAAVRDADVVL